MKKRDEKKNRKEITKAFSMIMQIGLAMMVCMGFSLGIGYYIDRLFQTHMGIIIMMIIGILASLRSMLVLTGVYRPGEKTRKSEHEDEVAKEKGAVYGDSKKDAD